MDLSKLLTGLVSPQEMVSSGLAGGLLGPELQPEVANLTPGLEDLLKLAALAQGFVGVK